MHQTEILWRPTDARVRQSQMFAFMTEMAQRYEFAPHGTALHRWSVERRDQFWGEMWKLAGIPSSQPATQVCAGEGMLGTSWFPGLQFNFAQHLLRFDDERVALHAVDELDRTRTITYRQLRGEVARLASAMRAAGVARGDRVGGFLPNIPEAVIAMLATVSLGAIWSSCSPDFGTQGVLDRFGQIEPTLLIAADGYSYNGKKIDCLERVRGIVEKIPSIRHTIIVPFVDAAPKIDSVPMAQLWSRFLDGTCVDAAGSDRLESRSHSTVEPALSALEPALRAGGPALRAGGPAFQPVFEPVPFDHPLYIMYSSGTTGIPKCIVHGHGGTLLQHMKELMLHCDLQRNDKIFYFTTCGWMMWNWLVSSLGVGATVVLYEGSPSHPTLDHLWRLADDIGITVFGTSPKFIASCAAAGIDPIRQHKLTNLRAVLSTGSPLTVENFRWVYEHVKKDVQLSSICGGTDIISCFMLGHPMLPVYAGEIQSLGLGMDVQAFGPGGKPVVGEKGELVCCSPFPSQPVGFWNDPDGSKYRKAYFAHYPGVWRHGDYVEITARGGVIVFGRSDATLNPGGVRIGTAEIYRQVEAVEEVADSIVVAKKTADGDEEVCLFVVLKPGLTLDTSLEKKIKQRIADGTTKRHVPRYVKQVTAIPYTISGKKVELAVTQMIHGERVLNRDALANPQALDQYAGIV